MAKVMMEFWKIEGKPQSYWKICRSWDGTVYMEMGETPPSGFPNPLPGRYLCDVENGRLQVCSFLRGAKIVQVPHRRIELSSLAERQIVESNAISA